MTPESQTPREQQTPGKQQAPQDTRAARKEGILTTCAVQAVGVIVALAAVAWVFRKRTIQVLGIAWVFAAFVWFFCFRHFYLLGRLPLCFSWPWHTRPAWVDYFSLGWNGVPWDALIQGGLLIWIAGVGAALGWRLMRALRPGTDWAGGVVWGGGLVLGALAMLVFAIGVGGGLTHARAVFGAILGGASLAAVWILWRDRPRGLIFRIPLSRAEWGLVAGTTGLQFLALLYALTPEVQSDAVRYHLAAPQEWLKAGRLSYLPYNAFSNFPSNIEMLFLFGLGLAGDLLAKGFHFLFLPLTTGAVALITHEILGSARMIAVAHGGDSDAIPNPQSSILNLQSAIPNPQSPILNPQSAILNPQSAIPNPQSPILNPQSPIARPWWHVRPSLLAAGAWGTLPITIPLAGWGFIDLGLTCFTLGLVFFLLRWTRTRQTGDWLLAAVFGGLLCGSKYTGVAAVFWSGVLLALFSLFRSPCADSEDSPSVSFGLSALRSVRRAVLFGAVAAAIASPWWIKNYVHTQNPVYPMAYSVFGGGEWSGDLARLYHEKTQEKGILAISHGPGQLLKNTLLLPWLTLNDPDLFERFEIGPLFWVFSPWILVWCLAAFRPRALKGPRAHAMLALWMLFFCLFWFFSYQSNRFFLPGWALCTVMIATALAQVGRWHPWVRALCLIGFLLPVVYGGLDSARWLLFDTGRLQFERKDNRITVKSGTVWPAYTLGYLTRQDYLALHLNYARSAEYCSAHLKPSDKVLLVGEHRKMHWLCRVEGNDWYDQPRILPFLNQAKDADQLLDILLAQGFTHIFFNLDEWGWPGLGGAAKPGELPPVRRGSAWDYNGRHFSRANIALLQDLLKSNRLKVVQSSTSGRIHVAKILPSSASPQPK